MVDSVTARAPVDASELVPEALTDAITGEAAARDADPVPPFPETAFTALAAHGLLGITAAVGARRPPAASELDAVRRVARADGSVGRIYDGHLNAVERVAVQGSRALQRRELASLASGELLAGVWGGDPGVGEGAPAALVQTRTGWVLRGAKTFCSGAGGLQRALVLARPPGGGGGPPHCAWVDLSSPDHVSVDVSWYRSHGLRASVSHRVVFRDAPVLELLGPPGAIAAQPWFARDALRTAASWAGIADSAVRGALAELAARPSRSELEALAAGRIVAAQHTISVWLHAAARAMDAAADDLPAVGLHARVAIADACTALLDTAARACGSRPFVRASRLDRARRDLEVFLLQHRLDPLLARAGAAVLETR